MMASLSWSQIGSWLSCPKQYELERLQAVPVPPAWWFIGGSAVHRATEELDLGHGDLRDVADETVEDIWYRVFCDEIDRAEAGTDVPRTGWRMSKGHDYNWWWSNGRRMVLSWLRFRRDSGWLIAEHEGRPAVEVPVAGMFGDHHLRGFVDRVMVTPDGELVVVDIKTGARVPTFPMQLGIYALLLRAYGFDVGLGAYWMADKGSMTDPFDVSGYTRDLVQSYTDGLGAALKDGVFLPNPGFMCAGCAVKDKCPVGPLLTPPQPSSRKRPALDPL